MNREAQQIEKVQFLVDGSHWSSKAKLKMSRPGSSSGGHLGCSESYNYNLYKRFASMDVDGAKNSQGREQMHVKSRRIYRGADKIVSVSKCKNWFCSLLKCVSIIFIMNIYVSDSTLSENFRKAVS